MWKNCIEKLQDLPIYYFFFIGNKMMAVWF